jgi:hypothetical protein
MKWNKKLLIDLKLETKQQAEEWIGVREEAVGSEEY